MRFWEGKFGEDWMNDDIYIDLRFLISRNVIKGKVAVIASRLFSLGFLKVSGIFNKKYFDGEITFLFCIASSNLSQVWCLENILNLNLQIFSICRKSQDILAQYSETKLSSLLKTNSQLLKLW